MSDGSLELEPLAHETGTRMEQTLVAVRAAIDDGRMTPGVKYSVYQLAETLGVSRTPVRDALLRLEEVGLIKFEARQGFRILLPDPSEIAEIFAVRIALEIPAARKAARTVDPKLVEALLEQQHLMRQSASAQDDRLFAQRDSTLHDLILEAAGNNRARTIVKAMRETTRLLGASTAHRTRSLADIDAEHTPIVDAIAAGDPEATELAMRAHLITTGKLLVAQANNSAISDASVEQIWATAVF